MTKKNFDFEMYRVMLPALVSRFENTILTELMASEVKINRKSLERALNYVFADPLTLLDVCDSAYADSNVGMYAHPLQVLIALPWLDVSPFVKRGKRLEDLVLECIYNSVKALAALGDFAGPLEGLKKWREGKL